nr:hypothetical protein [Halolamina pelagica]
MSAIKGQLEEQTGRADALEVKFKDFSEKASSAIVSASPVVLKAIAKGLVRKAVGVDVGEV